MRTTAAKQLIALALFDAVQLAVIAMLRLGGGGASAQVNAVGTFDLSGAIIILLPVGMLMPVLLALWISRRWRWLYVLALWLVPQMIVYGGALVERYQYPAILALCVGTPLALYSLRRNRVLFAAALLSLLLVAPLNALNIIQQRSMAHRWANEAAAWQALIADTLRNHPDAVELPYPDVLQIEYRVSARAFLRWHGYAGDISFGDDCEGRYC